MPELTLRRQPLIVDDGLGQALWVACDVTLAVAVIARVAPAGTHTTLVGFTFLAATWALVWRGDDEGVRRAGLALGGLVIPGRLDVREMLRAAGRALAWALGLTAAVAVPFFFLWRAWWHPSLTYSLTIRPAELANEALGQLLVIALPEEAFYRGYLQSRLDDVWEPRWNVLGARVGPGLIAAAAIFAAGHLATVQIATRLAVFVPALFFGWLRARTGGIGAAVCFHAICNVYSMLLGRGYGLY
jgi:membrane protease YdiL (CAAX protease family)